ncbi:MAG: FAD-dependent oxidoreductase [Bryobacteraceae bacterium]
MSDSGYDAVVIGAGIVGAACAADFASNGLRVAVIEAGVVGGGATAAGMGHLTVMDDSEAQFALTHYSQILWRELSPSLPPDVEYYPCGTIWVAADDEEMAEVYRKHHFYLERGVATEILDRAALADAEPNLRKGLAGGLLVPGDSVIYPPCAARFLVQEAERRGASVKLGRRVIEITGSGVRLDDGTSYSSAMTVIATGTAAAQWMPGIAMQPRKGHLIITDRYPGFLNHQLIELGYLKSAHALDADSVAFNVQPRRTGQILIGSSRQYGVEDSTTEPPMLKAMLRRAVEYMPGIANLSAIRSWTGFRAATPDKLPLIGRCPGYDNVYLATGHEGLGITTSLATARLLSDCILGRESAIPRSLYLPERSHALHV